MEPSSPLYLPRSDIEEDRLQQQQQRNVPDQLLKALGNLLDQAESGLNDVERNDLLGHAILRRCQELADAVGHLASQLDQQTDQERRDLAQACLEDQQLELTATTTDNAQQQGAVTNDVTSSSTDNSVTTASTGTISQRPLVTHDDLVNAIGAAVSLLREVESALRSIEPSEADDIADAAVMMARLFLMSLQSFHDTIDPATLTASSRDNTLTDDDRIEILEEGRGNDPTEGTPSSPSARQEWNRKQRIRALWPPLGPAVGQALDWGKNEAVKRPLLAVALGITLWPAAVATAFLGTPLVLADGLVQHVYENCQDQSLVKGLECGVAQLYHTGRFTLLCGKLVGKRTMRVVSRQVDEHGGVGNILQHAGHAALDRVAHPVETLSMTWDGVLWAASALQDLVSTASDYERGTIAQSLQQ